MFTHQVWAIYKSWARTNPFIDVPYDSFLGVWYPFQGIFPIRFEGFPPRWI